MRYFIILLLLAGQAAGQVVTNGGDGYSPRANECSVDVHKLYTAQGDDALWYYTWHPPVHTFADGEVCPFGHEHGDNPATYSAWDGRPVLFGYVNQQHTLQQAMGHRHEDHVGHKIEVVNDFNAPRLYRVVGIALPLRDNMQCSILAKLHQGAHSGDAFANNLHEHLTRMSCPEEGLDVDVQLLVPIGEAGTIMKQCPPQRQLDTYAAVPGDSPIVFNPLNPGKSGGDRFIPTTECVEAERQNTTEAWKTQNTINAPGQVLGFNFAWYWFSDPSRYYSGDPADPVRYMTDACYLQDENGNFLVKRNAKCAQIRSATPPIAWDDVRSPYRDCDRSIRVNNFKIGKVSGEWYTDALGMNASKTPFPGSVKQRVNNGKAEPGAYTPARSFGTNFCVPTTHAPN